MMAISGEDHHRINNLFNNIHVSADFETTQVRFPV